MKDAFRNDHSERTRLSVALGCALLLGNLFRLEATTCKRAL
jgi:hypothetical protein